MNNLEKFPHVFNISILDMKLRLLVEDTIKKKDKISSKFGECKFFLKLHLYTFPEKTESKS